MAPEQTAPMTAALPAAPRTSWLAGIFVGMVILVVALVARLVEVTWLANG